MLQILDTITAIHNNLPLFNFNLKTATKQLKNVATRKWLNIKWKRQLEFICAVTLLRSRDGRSNDI